MCGCYVELLVVMMMRRESLVYWSSSIRFLDMQRKTRKVKYIVSSYTRSSESASSFETA